MMDRDKVINGLEKMLEDSKYNDSVQYNPWADTETLEAAIALLKAQEPMVMTAEDMWALKFNDVVIIEQRIPSLLIPAIVRDNIKHDHCLEVLQVVTASTDRGANADYDYYGKTWRCWTSRPTDEQREATSWN